MLLHPLLWGDKVAWRCTTEAFIIGPVPCRLRSYFVPLLLLFHAVRNNSFFFFFNLPLPQHVAVHPTIHTIIHTVLPHDGLKKALGIFAACYLTCWNEETLQHLTPSAPLSLSLWVTSPQRHKSWKIDPILWLCATSDSISEIINLECERTRSENKTLH